MRLIDAESPQNRMYVITVKQRGCVVNGND